MRRCRELKDSTQYFHNLGFDGKFILDWLFKHNFTWIKDKKRKADNTFTTLIGDAGQFYSITIYFDVTDAKHCRKVTLYDSFKILPFSVADISTAFDLPVSKLSIDYKEYREPGHELTDEEIEYIRCDVEIVGRALKTLFDQGLHQITQGSNAMHYFKEQYGKKRFKNTFPAPEYDKAIREAYKGGFTYVNPRFKEYDLGEGIVLDVNSLYPSVMYYCPMPFGEGVQFDGEYVHDDVYPLYVQVVRCQFELKPKHIPTIQIKGSWRFADNEYIEDSGDEEITLYLSSVDLQLFFDHYNVYNVEFMGGWKFMSSDTMFRKYIDHWSAIKIEATKNHNKPMRTLAKLMLNAFYGKFGTNPESGYKMPYYDDELNKVRYKTLPELRDPVYLPVAIFTTAWARNKTIRSAQKVYDRFVYADTDSLHLIGTDIPEGLEVDDTKLGAWKHESTFKRAKFIRQKTYLEDELVGRKAAEAFIEENPKLKHFANVEAGTVMSVKCAGLPRSCYEYVTWDNFKPGVQYQGKLKPTTVNGGVVLMDTEFTMKS